MDVKKNSTSPFMAIFGGMGAEAGVLMHRIIIEETRRLKSVHCDQDDMDILHLSFGAQVPDRATYIWDQSQPSPVGPSIKSLESLALVAQQWGRQALAVIPCNTYHSPILFDQVRNGFKASPLSAHVRLYHMIEETAAGLKAEIPSLKKVGVLSTTTTRKMALFEQAFDPLGIQILQVDMDTEQPLVEDTIYNPIYGLKVAAKATPQVAMTLQRAIRSLKDNGAQGVILGCTELPLAFEEQEEFAGVFLVDPMRLVARKMIRDILSYGMSQEGSDHVTHTRKLA